MTADLQKVLVVDDETDVGDLLAYGLSAAGFHVVVACNGSLALCTAERWTPDIIVLDVMLPDIDGFTLLQKLRTVSASPVIFLSARGNAMDRARGLSLGAADYMTKPFDMDDLVTRLHSALP
jgi:two-component system OmpR family response regulator